MTRQADTAPPGVFVSYAPADERWAAWIAWQLEPAGFRTMLRAWDRPVGTPPTSSSNVPCWSGAR